MCIAAHETHCPPSPNTPVVLQHVRIRKALCQCPTSQGILALGRPCSPTGDHDNEASHSSSVHLLPQEAKPRQGPSQRPHLMRMPVVQLATPRPRP